MQEVLRLWFSIPGAYRFWILNVTFGLYFLVCFRLLARCVRQYLGYQRFRGRWYKPDELRRLKEEISDRFR